VLVDRNWRHKLRSHPNTELYATSLLLTQSGHTPLLVQIGHARWHMESDLICNSQHVWRTQHKYDRQLSEGQASV